MSNGYMEIGEMARAWKMRCQCLDLISKHNVLVRLFRDHALLVNTLLVRIKSRRLFLTHSRPSCFNDRSVFTNTFGNLQWFTPMKSLWP
jgi:hypothetical protein